jgi:hypothetical protein
MYPDFMGKISGVPAPPNLMEQIAASWRRWKCQTSKQ